MPERGDNDIRRRLVAFVLLVGFWSLARAESEGGSRALSVTATVVPYATLESATHVGSLTISSQDIERGWVRVPNAVKVRVRTNSRKGYWLQFRIEGDFVSGATVSVGRAKVPITRASPKLFCPTHRPTREQKTLDIRLDLADGIEPGVYYWPLVAKSVVVAR